MKWRSVRLYEMNTDGAFVAMNASTLANTNEKCLHFTRCLKNAKQFGCTPWEIVLIQSLFHSGAAGAGSVALAILLFAIGRWANPATSPLDANARDDATDPTPSNASAL